MIIKKVIDVSKYQGHIDWKSVKTAGVENAILKVIEKDRDKEPYFDTNWKNATANGLNIIGVYNYSYALSVSDAKKDAEAVIAALAGRKAKVWIDVEDKCQKNMGKLLINIILAYKEVIEKAGLEFGIYTGLSFYNSYIKPYASSITSSFWIARYPSNNAININHKPADSKKPAILHELELWQYSSKLQIKGISGNVDVNLWYYEEEKKPASKPVTENTTNNTTSKVVVTGDVNLREQPNSKTAKSLGIFKKGTEVEWKSDTGWGWSLVKVSGKTGYISNTYLSKAGLSKKKTVKNTTPVNFRRTASSASKTNIIKALPVNTKFEVAGVTVLSNGKTWMNTVINGVNGWICYNESYIK